MNQDLVRNSTPGAKHRLVILHGWGADANDLLPLGILIRQQLKIPLELVSLHAPEPHPQGVGRQWYGLFPADWEAVPGAIQSLQIRLKALATNEIPLEKTAILGFSQGGAMSIGACCELPFAGIIGCSSYPHPDWEAPKQRPSVLLIHGRQDNVVPYAASEKLLKELRISTSNVSLVGLDCDHTIPEESIPRIVQSLIDWFELE